MLTVVSAQTSGNNVIGNTGKQIVSVKYASPLNVVHVPLNPIIVSVQFDPITISIPGAGDGIGTSCDVIWSESIIFCTACR